MRMRRHYFPKSFCGLSRYFALFVAVLCGLSLHAQGTKRLALVVGNGNYRSVQRLTNPTNDADLIAAKLRSLGFTLIGGSAQKNLSLDQFNALVKQFATEAVALTLASSITRAMACKSTESTI